MAHLNVGQMKTMTSKELITGSDIPGTRKLRLATPVQNERHTEHHLSKWEISSQQEGYSWSIVMLKPESFDRRFKILCHLHR